MQGVLYAAVAAAFVLGLALIVMLARRPRATPARHAPGIPGAPEGDTVELDRLRSEAGAEATAIRKAAQADADAARLDAGAQRARAREHADTLLAEAREQVEAQLQRARDEARARLDDARRHGEDEAARMTAELARARAAVETRSARLDEVESRLDAQEARLSERAAAQSAYATELGGLKHDLDSRAQELAERADELHEAGRRHQQELERVAGLTAGEAKAQLLAAVETGARRDAATLVRSIENDARAEGTARARAIVVDAVQRVAGAQTAESVVSVLHLPADEMKGRIIGREGRNIRAFEAVTGVNVLIDDTPEAVLLSCFDPVRRETARVALDKLVTDGRIHPHRIEEAYEQSKIEVDELCLRAARDAVADVGVGHIDERLMPILGRLKYRTSYGQNVLHHLVETAHVAGVMAAELGVEPTLVKRSAFLHDIGKALTHEVEGSHAIVGAELLRKYGEDDAVAHAVEAHHNEVQPRTIEAVLTQAADTCSASRPGARRESVEAYVKRLARIEEIAGSRDGVDKVFAMQAGREVRVMVSPADVDDLAASVLAREIAKQIEDELTYPGQIRVTVVRESRSSEIAH